MSVTQQQLLDAMDGIAMILDHELRITQIGETNWQRLFDENLPLDPKAHKSSNKDVLNRPVTQFFAGSVVRSTFAELFRSVLGGKRPVVQIDYRCDAPTLRRNMRLSVRPIKNAGDWPHLLYQSVVLSVEQRPAIPMFGAAVADDDPEDILTLCAICARVAWPIGAPTNAREWIEPIDFYRRGGGEVVLLSHGFCNDCFAKLQEDD